MFSRVYFREMEIKGIRQSLGIVARSRCCVVRATLPAHAQTKVSKKRRKGGRKEGKKKVYNVLIIKTHLVHNLSIFDKEVA